MQKIILSLLLLVSTAMIGQVKGQITDAKKNPLSFVSISIENTTTGTTSNDNGDYILNLKKTGTYNIVFQFLGYKTITKKINISSFPYQLNISLQEESVVLQEISISTKDNPANAIIRNVIANKDKNTDKFSNYTADFYSRGLTKIKNAPEKILGQTFGDFGGGLDSTRTGIIYLSETVSKISYQKKPKKFKEKIIASKVSGEDNGVSFNRAQESNIDLYQNSIAIFNHLISPIATNAFSYYRYRLEGTFYNKDGKLINKIKLIPKRKEDRVFEGFIYIVEDDWAVFGSDVSVTGAQIGIPFVNTLKIKQGYQYTKKIDAWVLKTQIIDFNLQMLSFKPKGKFSYVYSNYNFSPKYSKKTFTNEVLSFEKGATKKDSMYWEKLRPVPLTKEEVKDYTFKDSIKTIRKSKKYLDSIDTKRNKFSWLSPLSGYTYNNSFKKQTTKYNGPLLNTGFNTVQGFYTSVGLNYLKRLNKKGKWWYAGAKINYGFSDKKLRPTFFFTKKWNNSTRPKITVNGGISTTQFNNREPITSLNNTFSTLFYRKNHSKIYEKTFAKINYSEEINNGIFLNTSLEYANRTPLFNSTDFSFSKKDIAYTSNNPLDATNFTNAAFNKHTIATLEVGALFVFDQKYLSYPDGKFHLENNKYPTLKLNYRKTFGANNAQFNSDAFTGNLQQEITAGNYGNFAYNIHGGIFLKKKNIPLMDQFQVNGNQLRFPLGSSEIDRFGLLNYYEFYSNDRYAEAHAQHNFRGAILGKIPLLNKLNFHLVTGSKLLITPGKNPYSEYAIGLKNIGFGKWRFLRVDYVQSYKAGIQKSGWLFGINLVN